MIKDNILKLKSEVPEYVTIVAISKTHNIDKIKEAYECGIIDFGENKVQELNEKQKNLSLPIRWHMVGHLQTNKVKYIAPFIHLIHSLDSLKLAKEINKFAQKNNRIIDCLLQVHIAKEETKFGLYEKELYELIENPEFTSLKNINIKGLMGMATFTDDTKQIEKEFKFLRNLFEKLKNNFPSFTELSMGMSNDYKIAIACGSTMIRVGTLIFGERIIF
ncbi:MAG: YggS family pyridoxal phosphate-dependent enzyme [Bacteroidales bacterium]|nr:YggS family pyridoxal phosphate-dependent enzyme [Bacteroidales bacterium]